MILDEAYSQIVTENILNVDKVKFTKKLRDSVEKSHWYNNINEVLKDLQSQLQKCSDIKKVEFYGQREIPGTSTEREHIEYRFICFVKSGDIYDIIWKVDDLRKLARVGDTIISGPANFRTTKYKLSVSSIYNKNSCQVPPNIAHDFVDLSLKAYSSVGKMDITIKKNRMQVTDGSWDDKEVMRRDINRANGVYTTLMNKYKNLEIRGLHLIYKPE